MTEPDPDNKEVDLARLNNNILTAIRYNKSVFSLLSHFNKRYVTFRTDPQNSEIDYPDIPIPFDGWPELLAVIKTATAGQDLTTNELLDLTTLEPHQLAAIYINIEAFKYLKFQEQVWLYNQLGYPIKTPKPFFPSNSLILTIRNADDIVTTAEYRSGGKRKKSRKPSSHYKPTKSRKTRRRK
jgi:hypothetical protein